MIDIRRRIKHYSFSKVENKEKHAIFSVKKFYFIVLFLLCISNIIKMFNPSVFGC